jgi:hypothetical protein
MYVGSKRKYSDGENINLEVRFDVFTAVTMKNAVFWDAAPCRYCVNRRFGGMYRLHLQAAATCSRWFLARGFSTRFNFIFCPIHNYYELFDC